MEAEEDSGMVADSEEAETAEDWEAEARTRLGRRSPWHACPARTSMPLRKARGAQEEAR